MAFAPATTPKGDHVLSLAGGRRVAWAEWGSPDGQPVLLLHRNPGSRLLDPDVGSTARAGARLITIDRPGYGRTDPVADPTRSAVASDLAAVVGDIPIDQVALIGWSGGGMFALEAAAKLGSACAPCHWYAPLRRTRKSPGCPTTFELSRPRSRQIRNKHSQRSPRHAVSTLRTRTRPSSQIRARPMQRFGPSPGSPTLSGR